MFDKILIPLDFSASSELVVRIGRDLARASEGTVLLLHVSEPIINVEGLAQPPTVLDLPEFNVQLEATKVDLIREGGVTVDTRCARGSPASEILRVAGEEGVDLIVMGTHGRTGLRHLLLGSVAEAVVRRASCPVLTLKLGGRAERLQEGSAQALKPR